MIHRDASGFEATVTQARVRLRSTRQVRVGDSVRVSQARRVLYRRGPRIRARVCVGERLDKEGDKEGEARTDARASEMASHRNGMYFDVCIYAFVRNAYSIRYCDSIISNREIFNFDTKQQSAVRIVLRVSTNGVGCDFAAFKCSP